MHTDIVHDVSHLWTPAPYPSSSSYGPCRYGGHEVAITSTANTRAYQAALEEVIVYDQIPHLQGVCIPEIIDVGHSSIPGQSQSFALIMGRVFGVHPHQLPHVVSPSQLASGLQVGLLRRILGEVVLLQVAVQGLGQVIVRCNW